MGWKRRKKEAACYAGKNENAASPKGDKVGVGKLDWWLTYQESRESARNQTTVIDKRWKDGSDVTPVPNHTVVRLR